MKNLQPSLLNLLTLINQKNKRVGDASCDGKQALAFEGTKRQSSHPQKRSREG